MSDAPPKFLCTCMTSALLPCRAHTDPDAIRQRHENAVDRERVDRIASLKRWRAA